MRRVFAPHLAGGEAERTWTSWRRTLRLLRPLGAVSLGNTIEVFADGDRAFEAMWEALAAARSRVLLNTYIFVPDPVGRRTLDELTAAARRGCEVIVVLDGFGSYRLEDRDLRPLREAGGTVLVYNPPLRFTGRRSRLVRNHRKIMVVDDRVAFCGGMNVTADYAGPRYGTNLFRDTHLKIEGPSVRDLATLCVRIVREVGVRAPVLPPAPEASGPGALVQILESNVRRQKRAIQKALRYTTARAVSRCYLTSPYFVPPKRLMRDLRRAARRGVDVRVLTAGRSDVPLVRLASQHLHGRLLRAGVRIFEMQEPLLHSKTVAIDGVYACVGSFNLDYWSYRRNLEVTVSVLDARVARDLEKRFEEDLASSREVTLENWSKRTWWQRLLHWLAYQVSRI